MPRIVFFQHSIRSDWNNGNAHFLRGLARELGNLGHRVTVCEPAHGWSFDNLLAEPGGEASLAQFAETYPDLDVRLYDASDPDLQEHLRQQLRDADFVIVHEWNTATLIEMILELRSELGFRAVFHDTHHRASSSPESIRALQVGSFDGVLAFGDALTEIYRRRFGISRCWTLHEAADTSVFYPREGTAENDLVWVGNWGDGERSSELHEYLIGPARAMRTSHPEFRSTIYGVRYPADGLRALEEAGIRYGGYLANLAAPAVYASARLTMHVPRQQYATAMRGIPTIRVFEALASGIPLISAPWQDTEEMFREGDFAFVHDGRQALETMQLLLSPAGQDKAQAQIEAGLATVLARHTCVHRAAQLTRILTEEVA